MTTSNLKHRDYLTRNDTSKNMQISSRLCQRTLSQPWLILQGVTILYGKYHTLHLVAKCLSVHPGSDSRDSATLSNILELSVPGTLQASTSHRHSWQLGCYFQDMRFSRPSLCSSSQPCGCPRTQCFGRPVVSRLPLFQPQLFQSDFPPGDVSAPCVLQSLRTGRPGRVCVTLKTARSSSSFRRYMVFLLVNR